MPPPTPRGLIWSLLEISEKPVASRLCLDKFPERRRNSGHRPDAATNNPAELLPGLKEIFAGACIYDEHPTKLILRAPCKHIDTSGKMPAAVRTTAPSAHRTGSLTGRTPGRRAQRSPARGRFSPFPPGATSSAKLLRVCQNRWATTRAVCATGGTCAATPALSATCP